jgi:hypothetical protein
MNSYSPCGGLEFMKKNSTHSCGGFEFVAWLSGFFSTPPSSAWLRVQKGDLNI